MPRGTVLRGILPPNLLGMPRGTVLRMNGVFFSARELSLNVSARDSATKPARNAQCHRPAREWGIFFRAGSVAERFCNGLGYLFRLGLVLSVLGNGGMRCREEDL